MPIESLTYGWITSTVWFRYQCYDDKWKIYLIFVVYVFSTIYVYSTRLFGGKIKLFYPNGCSEHEIQKDNYKNIKGIDFHHIFPFKCSFNSDIIWSLKGPIRQLLSSIYLNILYSKMKTNLLHLWIWSVTQ